MIVEELIELLKTYEPNRSVVLCVDEGDHKAFGEEVDGIVIDNDLVVLAAATKDETWGRAAWSDVDIEERLKEQDIRPTKELVEEIRNTWYCRHIADSMVEEGWTNIDLAIDEVARVSHDQSAERCATDLAFEDKAVNERRTATLL
jgi:hypothetical protein